MALLLSPSLAACSAEDAADDGTPAPGPAAESESTSAPGEASGEVSFHGELRPFDGLDLDSGMQPAASPVQVSLAFKVDGGLTLDAKAMASGAPDAATVTGMPGSGKQEIKAQLKAEAKLKVAMGAFNYDGPLPGVEALDIAFGGTSTFDPFLLDGESLATADVPETTLPPIPLPGGIPGSIVLTIEKGSIVRSSFRGTCANVTSGSSPTAHYVGASKLDGELLVHATVELHAPLTKKFEIPSFKVKLPARDLPIDLGDVAVTGRGTAPAGGAVMTSGEACSASSAPKSDQDPDSDSMPDATPDPTPDPTPGDSCESINVCTSAIAIGTIAGDGSAVAAPLTASGTTRRWLAFRVAELDNGTFGENLGVRATLNAPPGWTFIARMNTASDVASACGATQYKPTANNILDLTWGEGFGANGADDSRNVVIEIQPAAGTCSQATAWTFKVERH